MVSNGDPLTAINYKQERDRTAIHHSSAEAQGQEANVIEQCYVNCFILKTFVACPFLINYVDPNFFSFQLQIHSP